MFMGKRFCISKGKEGWGDRLQCLLQAIRYSEKTGRELVLDWRDDDWCHDKTEDVSKYFTINGHKYTLNDFFNYYEQNKTEMEVAPRDWGDKITDPNYQNYIYTKPMQYGRKNDILYKIATKGVPDFHHEIVVAPCSGVRAWTWDDIAKIRLSNLVEKSISDSYEEIGLHPGKYIAVHLRGGSKAWNGGEVGQKKLRNKINTKFPTKNDYFEFLYEKYKKVNNKLPVMLMTDYAPMADEWIDRYGCGLVLKTENSFFKKCGTHKIKPEEMQKVSKQTLTIQTLRDFSVLINSAGIVHDELSYFSNMAFGAKKRNIKFANSDKKQVSVKTHAV